MKMGNLQFHRTINLKLFMDETYKLVRAYNNIGMNYFKEK